MSTQTLGRGMLLFNTILARLSQVNGLSGSGDPGYSCEGAPGTGFGVLASNPAVVVGYSQGHQVLRYAWTGSSQVTVFAGLFVFANVSGAQSVDLQLDPVDNTNQSLSINSVNSAADTKLMLYSNFVDTANYARLLIKTPVTGDILLQSAAAGSGTVRNIMFDPGTADIKWGKALVALGGGAAATLGTIGGSGPAAAAQNTWLRLLDSAGNACWVPVWK